MPNIENVNIGVNRYAPAGANNIDLYKFQGAGDFTLGQLIMSVCIQRAATLEHASIQKANEMTQTSGLLKALALFTEKLMDNAIKTLETEIDLASTGYVPKKCPSRPTMLEFLTLELGLKVTSSNIDSYSAKIAVYNLYRQSIDSATNLSQRQTIDLQSLVSRRDVAYNTSASIVRNILSGSQFVVGEF